MPVNITDQDEFTSPIQAPDDGDPANGATFQIAPQGLANRTNFLRNRLMPSARVMSPANLKPCSHLVEFRNGLVDPVGGTHTLWDQDKLYVGGGAESWFSADLGAFLVHGETLASVKVRVKPGGARATQVNRMRVLLVRSAYTGGVSTEPIAYDDGSTNEQEITVSPGWTIDKSTYAYSLFVRGGVTSESNWDIIYNTLITPA